MPLLTGPIAWFLENYIEVFAVITGLLYVVYTIKEKTILWLFGIISSALYISIFYQSNIYAYALLYVYYVLIGFYGWFKWNNKGTDPAKKENLRIHKANRIRISLYLLIISAITLPVFFILRNFTDSDMAFIDALLTAGGMVATWMLTQKILQHWLFWIVINVLSCGTMIYKGLYPSALLFMIYGIMAVKGFIEWKKDLGQT